MKHIRAILNRPTIVELDSQGQLPAQVMVLPVGQYETSKYGSLSITDENLAQAVSNFNKGIPNGVPINLDHMYGAAAGWVTGLIHQAGQGLFALVEWTSLGEQQLTDKLYRFISAEFDFDYEDPSFGNKYGFVLTGAALTNYPLMQELPALMADSKENNQPIILFSREGASMNLDEIRVKDAASLTDEEKQFLTDHAAELNEDERTKFGIDAPAEPTEPAEPAAPAEPTQPAQPTTPAQPAEPIQASANPDGSVRLSQAEFSALKQRADAGMEAKLELDKQRLEREVEQLTFSQTNQAGRFLPKSKGKLSQFVGGLSASARQEFAALMAELPSSTHTLFSELGDGGNTGTNDPASRLNALAEAKVQAAVKDGQKLNFSQALMQVSAEHPELVNDAYKNSEGVAE